MLQRTTYEMTEEDLVDLLTACRPTPAMIIGGYVASGVQEQINEVWQRLGEKMGFDYMTAKPVDDKGKRYFSAIPSAQRETEKKHLSAIKILERKITKHQKQLNALRKPGDL